MEIKTLISHLKDNPDLLYSLKPREFEELIAEIFAGLGWNVNLTKQSRDGGVDIFATSTDKADFKTAWIIECKNYKKERKVGIEQVRQLDFIKTTLKIPNAILATTSSFSKQALQIANSRYDIKLIDSSDIIQRINRYLPPPPEKESYIENRNFYSCFISYSHKDQEFTDLLYTELKNRNVHVWYAPEDLHPGKKINEEVTKAIKIFDKLLIVLSENSMKSEWVHDSWKAKGLLMAAVAGCKVAVSDILEKAASDLDKAEGLDLVDYLLRVQDSSGLALTDLHYPVIFDYSDKRFLTEP